MGKVDFRTVKTKNLRNPRDRAPLKLVRIKIKVNFLKEHNKFSITLLVVCQG